MMNCIEIYVRVNSINSNKKQIYINQLHIDWIEPYETKTKKQNVYYCLVIHMTSSDYIQLYFDSEQERNKVIELLIH